MSAVQLSNTEKEIIWNIRQQAMYPNNSIDVVKLPGDEMNIHFAWKINNEIVSVITVENEGDVFQFRKFATLPIFQNKGYGSQLLAFVLGWIQVHGGKKVWCNARVSASKYYQKFGMITVGTVYEKNNIQFIRMEKTY